MTEPNDQPTAAGIPGTVTWRELLEEAVARLDTVSESPQIDAQRIVEEASGSNAAELALRQRDPVTTRQVARFDELLGRRLTGEPLQYVLGHWGFRHLDLAVDRRALIPRPETEGVVDVALAQVDRIAAVESARVEPILVVDLGTGSGAIALAIASERRNVDVWATDRSAAALALARANLAGLGRDGRRVRLAEGSWFDALPTELAGRVDVIVANPPYVATGDELDDVVRSWEPPDALFSGPTGLDDLMTIADGAPDWLMADGALVVEFGTSQASALVAHLDGIGFVDIEVADDLAGRPRALSARWPGRTRVDGSVVG